MLGTPELVLGTPYLVLDTLCSVLDTPCSVLDTLGGGGVTSGQDRKKLRAHALRHLLSRSDCLDTPETVLDTPDMVLDTPETVLDTPDMVLDTPDMVLDTLSYIGHDREQLRAHAFRLLRGRRGRVSESECV